MTGDEFLEYASQAVAVPDPTEPARRTAVSRAYYGVFHIASKFLRDSGFGNIGDRHITVWKYLQISGHPAAAEAGHRLSALYQQRVRADYKIDAPKWGKLAFAKECVTDAQEVAQLLSQCQAAKDDIRRTIKAFSAKAWRQVALSNSHHLTSPPAPAAAGTPLPAASRARWCLLR